MNARGVEGKARRRKQHITKLIGQAKRDAARIIELEAELARYRITYGPLPCEVES